MDLQRQWPHSSVLRRGASLAGPFPTSPATGKNQPCLLGASLLSSGDRTICYRRPKGNPLSQVVKGCREIRRAVSAKKQLGPPRAPCPSASASIRNRENRRLIPQGSSFPPNLALLLYLLLRPPRKVRLGREVLGLQ